MTRLLFILILPALISCNQHTQPQETQKQTSTEATPTAAIAPVAVKDSFKTGVVIPQVTVNADALQSYALYLPAKYSDSAKLPVIIFFDPHGDGELPLNLYKALAEKYGYIMLGSNSSHNGMDFEQTNVVANNLITEAQTRFHVDEKKLAICGFSGGAKVALLSGADNPAVSTIIYCGAAADIKPNHPITLLGFAGTKDMNYTDVVAFDWGLKNSAIPHYLIQWKGKHEFPVAAVFKDAFDFLSTGKIENYAQKEVTITAQKVDEEQGIKQNLYQSFQSENLNWWKQEIAVLNSKKQTDPMYERLLGFVSLACYSFSNRLLQQNDMESLGKILSIYKMADPENKDCDSLTKVYRGRMKGGG